MSEAGRFAHRDGVAASAADRVAVRQHGGLVRGVADALQFQRATAAAEDRGAVPKWLVTILLFFELSLLAGERTCGRGRGGGVDLDVAAQDRRLRFDVGGGDCVHRGVGHCVLGACASTSHDECPVPRRREHWWAPSLRVGRFLTVLRATTIRPDGSRCV